jgi:hypothetical protein
MLNDIKQYLCMPSTTRAPQEFLGLLVRGDYATQVHIIADLQNNLAQLSAVLTAFRQTHAND